MDDLVDDLRRSTKDLAHAAGRLSKRLASRADVVAKDPKGSAKKALHVVAKEIDSLAKDLDEMLTQL